MNKLTKNCEAIEKNKTVLSVMIQDCKGTYELCDNTCYYNSYVQSLNALWPQQFAYPIYGVVFPILLFLTIVSNVFIVIILSRKHMASSTNRCLLYMAIADLFVGIVPFPFTFFYFSLRNFENEQTELKSWWCYMAHYLMDALPPIAHNIAIWLTVLLAFQRYIFICNPFLAKRLCTLKRVELASACILVISLLFGTLKLYDVEISVFHGVHVDFGYTRLCMFQASAILSFFGENALYSSYFWIRATVYVFIPSVMLIIFNALLMREVNVAKQRRKRLAIRRGSNETKSLSENYDINLMLVIVVTLFLVVNLPQGIYFVLVCINQSFDLNLSLFESEYLHLFLMIDNMLIIATYPLNFAIYCSMSSKFRETFKNMIYGMLHLKKSTCSNQTIGIDKPLLYSSRSEKTKSTANP
ncbi:FMRFamide receptor [Trichinella pseudospiralis]|uniref:FMRFamide receptor n=1 Tax=Trichinella pseudospiralis TaxID=6337 RepID=A0A0V1F1Q8_TRIPS|nr:FMRFamide receptor [Trichinella pseudospiralis]KRZ27072.1 FMRFamide receptor [Trichinella pseudospiralis]KRZ43192.1 FMRFamide receptor [Trichinella pseudospiralis]